MSIELIGILGGLIGSILTVAITKVLDLIQKKNEYTYDLKKQFFAKKLQAAESAIMQYSIFIGAFNQLSILYSRYKANDTHVEKSLNDNLLKQINESIVLANSSSFALSNAINLYFDLHSNYSSNQILTHFYDQLNMLTPYSENVEAAYEQYLQYEGTDKESEAYKIYLQTETYLGEAMKNAGEKFKFANEELRNQIFQIRNEMKKYD